MNFILKQVQSYRGSRRLSPPKPSADVLEPGQKYITASADGAPLLVEGEPPAPTPDPTWLEDARKLIPAEALTGYISFQALAANATHPENVKVILALIFLNVTVFLSWIGSEDAKASDPPKTAQPGVVIISSLSFMFLVYATNGQIWWHKAIDDQAIYGQILSGALGIVGPIVYRQILNKKAP